MEIFEQNMESCKYCKITYYEYDTGYRAYGCSFFTENEKDVECCGGDIKFGCPLSFRYSVENK